MRLVVQRVSQASVTVDGKITGQIGRGLLVLVGIGQGDSEEDARYLAEKIIELRIFEDRDGKMNKSLRQLKDEDSASGASDPSSTGFGVLSVSQFTLYGDCRKGRRPSYTQAEQPNLARELYDFWKSCLTDLGFPPEDGVFAAHMDVALVNDGPVTLLLDSSQAF